MKIERYSHRCLWRIVIESEDSDTNYFVIWRVLYDHGFDFVMDDEIIYGAKEASIIFYSEAGEREIGRGIEFRNRRRIIQERKYDVCALPPFNYDRWYRYGLFCPSRGIIAKFTTKKAAVIGRAAQGDRLGLGICIWRDGQWWPVSRASGILRGTLSSTFTSPAFG